MIPGFEFVGDWDSWQQPLSFLCILTVLCFILLFINIKILIKLPNPFKTFFAFFLVVSFGVAFISLSVGHTYVIMKQLYFPNPNHIWSLGSVSHHSAKIWVKSDGDESFFLLYKNNGSIS